MKVIKTIAMFLALTLVTAVLTACSINENPIDPTDNSSKYDFTAYFGNPDDGVIIENIVNEYEKENGIKIGTVVSEGSVRAVSRLMNSSNPPAIYLLSSDTDMSKLKESNRVLNLMGVIDGTDNEGVPWSVEGFGLISDRRLLSELSSGLNTDDYISDMRKASYVEWTRFAAGLDDYIKYGKVSSYKLNKRSYSFPAEKGELTSKLNGVYAIAGSDPSIVVGGFMSAGLTDFEIYTPVFEAYTDRLAGMYASGIRGTDFINKSKYSAEDATKIFAAGKAAFLVSGSGVYEDIRKSNAYAAENSIIIPLKTPAHDSSAKLLERSNYIMYVNPEVSEETRSKAIDFLKWYMDYKLKKTNSLERSVLSYCIDGSTISYPNDEKRLEDFGADVFKNKSITSLMADPEWDDAKRAEFSAALAETWGN